MDDKTKRFINEHIRDDVHQLALQADRFPEIDMRLATRQILGKQKIEYKVPTFFNTEDILYPVRLSLEQSSSETTAQYKASLCEGESLLDLTGGLGVDCYFMSKKFNQVVYVEQQSELCELAKHNFNVLGVNNITVVNSNAEEYIHQSPEVDCIFIDPARRNASGKKLVLLSDCEPDISKLSPALLSKAKQVLIKLSPMLDISSVTRELPNVSEVHVIAIENECKEILLSLKKEKSEKIRILTINFAKENKQQFFHYYLDEEKDKAVNYTSSLKKYLYEPNAAVMKSGGYNALSNYYNMEKLHPHTHLYTSDELMENFPGRIFEVKSVWSNSKEARKKLVNSVSKANVTTRNFPESAEFLRKKLKLSDGGDCYLFACTLSNSERKIIECGKI